MILDQLPTLTSRCQILGSVKQSMFVLTHLITYLACLCESVTVCGRMVTRCVVNSHSLHAAMQMGSGNSCSSSSAYVGHVLTTAAVGSQMLRLNHKIDFFTQRRIGWSRLPFAPSWTTHSQSASLSLSQQLALILSHPFARLHSCRPQAAFYVTAIHDYHDLHGDIKLPTI